MSRTYKVYSLKEDGYKRVSPHFRVREFRCRDGSDLVLICQELVELLEQLRQHFGKPIIINSGFRSQAHNKSIGGAAHSKHLYGLAADIVVQGVSPAKVADAACAFLGESGGVGRYSNFTHVDVRERGVWRG